MEEAAGVSKYRVKKREALVKLAQTEENLLRVGDIIQEVESRLEPLARQAEAAAVYESLERELASVEVTLLSSELAAAAKAVAALERDLEEREKERRTATGRLETLELKIGELTATIDALDEEIEALESGPKRPKPAGSPLSTGAKWPRRGSFAPMRTKRSCCSVFRLSKRGRNGSPLNFRRRAELSTKRKASAFALRRS